MGAWGDGLWENDDALDWVFELEEADDWGVVEAALRNAADVSPNTYLDADVGTIACAAAAVVAAVDDPTIEVPPEVSAWLGRFGGTRSDQVRLLALLALRRVLGAESELADVWLEPESEAQWRAHVEAVAASLGATGVRVPSDDEAMARRLGIPVEFLRDPEPASRDEVAKELNKKGNEFSELGRRAEALELYDVVIERFDQVPERVASALINKGLALSDLERFDEALAAFDLVIDRFGESPDTGLRDRVAKAMYSKVFELHSLGRAEEAIATCDELEERFGEASEPGIRGAVANGLVYRGLAIGDLGRFEEAIEVFESVIERVGEAPEPWLRSSVAWALVDKGFMLAQLDRSGEAMEYWDLVLARFGETTEPQLQEPVAKALGNKGLQLAKMDRTEEAIQVFELMVTRFGESPDRALRELAQQVKVPLAELTAPTDEQP